MDFKDLSDEVLIEKVKSENSSGAVEELSNRHSGVVGYCLKKYTSAALASSGISINELFDEKEYLVYNAAMDFDAEKKVKFSTWLSNKTRYYCLETLKANNKYVAVDPVKINFFVESNHVELDTLKLQECREYVIHLLDKLKDKRIKKIVMLRYFSDNKKDHSFKSIAKKLKMSGEGVILLHDNFLSFLKTKINSKENQDII